MFDNKNDSAWRSALRLRYQRAKTVIADNLLDGVPSGLSLADANALLGETIAVAG